MKLSEEQCKYLIDTAESKNQWSRIRGGSKTSYKTVVLDLDDNSIIDLFSIYCSKILNIQHIPFRVAIIRYDKGDLIQRHKDNGSNFGDAYNFTRDALYNINIRLNSDYKGGEFYLSDQLFYRPVGEIYHYKSDTYHEVKMITEGVRYLALLTISYQDTLTNASYSLI